MLKRDMGLTTLALTCLCSDIEKFKGKNKLKKVKDSEKKGKTHHDVRLLTFIISLHLDCLTPPTNLILFASLSMTSLAIDRLFVSTIDMGRFSFFLSHNYDPS